MKNHRTWRFPQDFDLLSCRQTLSRSKSNIFNPFEWPFSSSESPVSRDFFDDPRSWIWANIPTKSSSTLWLIPNFETFCFLGLRDHPNLNYAWRTLANQEVILQIGPLGKLGHFESAAEIFLVYIDSISLASGPILSITSWYAKVLCELWKI